MSKDLEEQMIALTQRLDDHLVECNKRSMEVDVRLDKLIQAQELNATNIADLTKATQGVVEAWTVANGLSKFLKWLSSFAIIGASIIWLKDFIK
tara:strand:+ start:2490 stop:2771 length:282 start_codon:yes stop_codon:yes gene_type:complete